MKKNLREQLRSQPLPEDDLSEEEQMLLRQMLDRQLEHKWAEMLKGQGIHRTPPKTARQVWMRPLIAVAAVLIFGAFGWWLYLQQVSAKRTATACLEQVFPVAAVNRGDASTDVRREQSLLAYERADYQTALASLSPLLNEGQAEDFFLAALCNQYLKNYQEATDLFEKTKKADPAFNRDEVEWRLGLIYILLDEKEQAKTALTNVANSSSSRNKEAARQLLEKIGS